MKNNIIKLFVLFLASIVSGQISFPQNMFPGIRSADQSDAANQLMNRMSDAKLSGDLNKIQEIQSDLDMLHGSLTVKAADYGGGFVYVNMPVPAMDNINAVEISQLNGIRALATVTEQRGQNAGRIWVIAAFSNSSARDTIYYFRTDDGGVSWVLWAYIYLSNQDEVNYDQMDSEIIEDNVGDKYLWTVYGITMSTGKRIIAGNVIKTPNVQYSVFSMLWQGENLNNLNFSHFRPRIATDNAKYNNTAALYIIASEDSLVTDHVAIFKFAKCVNPYTTTPNITYYPRYNGLLIGSQTMTDQQIDIAYLHNGGDTLLISAANYSFNPEFLGFGKINTDFELNLNSYNFPNNQNFDKQYARIACSGGTNQKIVMLVYRENYQNSGDWDIKGYRSIDGGTNWGAVDLDIRRDNIMIPYPPDICAVRSRDGRFNIAYTVAGPANFDTVKYVFTNAIVQGLYFRTVNHLSGFERPKPGFRLTNNDSCFVVWSQKNNGSGNNIWASGGCNGQITIGIEPLGNEVPTFYRLEQNYPNPFNPVTNIKFSIPNPGMVKLEVYNLLGETVKTLVNENLSQGNYKIDFNTGKLASGVYIYRLEAGNFSEIKKMVLIK